MLPSVATLAPGVNRKIDRLLALGYAEAKRRRSSPVAQLDALMEVTIAVCDLFPPESLATGDFYLSVVDLTLSTNSRKVSSLASFDDDLRSRLGKLGSGSCQVPLDGFTLAIPQIAQGAEAQLRDFWADTARDLGIDVSSTVSVSAENRARRACEPDDFPDFGRSLRHAFDAMLLDEWRIVESAQDVQQQQAYTLRVHRGGSHDVSDGVAVDYALGYWLPTGTLHRLCTRKSSPLTQQDVSTLEKPLAPAPGEHARSQSHTNVETRLAGLVRHQAARSEILRADPRRAMFKAIDDVEKKAWGDTQPDHVFLMPIPDYDFGPVDNGRPITIAHWYVGISGKPDLEWLLGLRQRASLIFVEALLRRYYTAAARVLASGLVSAAPDHIDEERKRLNRKLAGIAEAHCVSSELSLIQGTRTDNVLIDLQEVLRLDLAVTKEARSHEWIPKYQSTLASNRLHVGNGRERLQVLVRLIPALDREVRELEFNKEIAGELGRFKDAITELQDVYAQIHSLTVPDDDGERIWNRLIATQELSAGQNVTGEVHQYSSQPKTLDNWPEWSFVPGHAICENRCAICCEEEVRRVAFVCGAPLPADCKDRTPAHFGDSGEWFSIQETSPQRNAGQFITFASGVSLRGESGALMLIKRACEISDYTAPKLASIVAVLLAAGARLDPLIDVCVLDRPLSLLPDGWPGALVGLAELSRHDAGARPSDGSIALAIEEHDLRFRFNGLDSYKWFNSVITEAAGASGPLRSARRARSSRFASVVKAYGWRAPLPLKVERVEKIRFELLSDSLVCTWIGVNP